jgi:tetratricopeptide (TPR) repeat protein
MDRQANPFLDRRVALAGNLESMTLSEAETLVRRLGGTPVPRNDAQIDLLVVGAEELTGQASPPAARNTITETELWQQLGLLEDGPTRQLYTPAMLADHKTIHRLPYFAFEEIVVARRLVELVANGASVAEIDRQLGKLARCWPGVSRPLAQLALEVEGRRLLVKRGGAVLEAHGQQRFDFGRADDEESTIPLRIGQPRSNLATAEQLVAQAEELDEAGDPASAADLYRAALVAGGPTAQVCFQLAECLYQLGDLSAARERYWMAIELDDAFLEARANLGCVLSELGQTELAIGAFEGALALHPDYADAHYHLIRLLESSGRISDAERHRRRFAELAPASPWLGVSVAPMGEG